MYGDVQAMIDRFGQAEITRLSQIEDRATDIVDDNKVKRALEDAAAIIDGYLRGRYKVPVVNPPADLIRAACIIARYDLAKSAVSEPTEQMQKDYDAIMKWLSEVQKGIVNLDAETVGSMMDGAYGARFEDREAIFTPHSLRGA